MNTGLTDKEKESLLKLFLVHTIVRCDDHGKNHTIEFFNSPERISKEHCSLIVKAMDNLRGIR